MAQETNGAEALLDGMADRMAAMLRKHFDALEEAPVVGDPAAVDKALKAMITAGRLCLMVRAVKAAEDKLVAEMRQRRSAQMDQMEMNDIATDELERRAGELRARADRILALIEAKCGGSQPVVAEPAGELRDVGGEPPRRAA